MYSFAHYALPLVGLPFYPSVARALFLDRILPQSCLDISLTRFQESGILEKNLWVVHVTAISVHATCVIISLRSSVRCVFFVFLFVV